MKKTIAIALMTMAGCANIQVDNEICAVPVTNNARFLPEQKKEEASVSWTWGTEKSPYTELSSLMKKHGEDKDALDKIAKKRSEQLPDLKNLIEGVR